MPRIARNGIQGGNAALSALTDSSGVATFLIPSTSLAVYQGAVPVVVRAVSSSTDRASAQISAEPALGTVNTTGLSVRVTVSQSNTTGVLLGAVVAGLSAAPAGVVVRLFPHGT